MYWMIVSVMNQTVDAALFRPHSGALFYWWMWIGGMVEWWWTNYELGVVVLWVVAFLPMVAMAVFDTHRRRLRP